MNGFQRYGIDIEEWASALADALANGGADEEEIREAVLMARLEEAIPDDGEEWRLYRLA